MIKKVDIPCIYLITCIENNKIYIGQTCRFNHRTGQHLSSLRKGSHFNKYLQRLYNKYGESKIKFSIEVECNIGSLNEEERRVFFYYKSTIPNLVINSRVDPVSNRGIKKPKESVKKQSDKLRGRPTWNKGIPMTEEAKANLSQSLKGRKVWNTGTSGSGVMKSNKTSFTKGHLPANIGCPKSDETKIKISVSRRGKGTGLWKDRGLSFSVEALKKMSIAKKGIKRGTPTRINKYIDIETGEIVTTKDLVKIFSVNRSTILLWRKHNNPKLEKFKLAS